MSIFSDNVGIAFGLEEAKDGSNIGNRIIRWKAYERELTLTGTSILEYFRLISS